MPKHFKSMKAYRKYLAYIKIHGIKTDKNVKYQYIHGKKHYIKHRK
ncbi:MAG: hypothetical protein QXI16_00170 [Sulfolobaceae archaeon]